MVDGHYSLICLLFMVSQILIIAQHNKFYSSLENKKTFLSLLICSLSFCTIDMCWGFVAANPHLSINFGFSFTALYYILAAVAAYCSFIFIYSYNEKNFKRPAIVKISSFFPVLIVMGIVVMNYFTKAVYEIKPDGSYIRLNPIYIVIIYACHFSYLASAFGISLYSYLVAKKQGIRISRSLILFSLIPAAGGLVQYFDPYQPWYSLGFFFACFMIYSFELAARREQELKDEVEYQFRAILDECSEVLYSEDHPENNINRLLGLLAKYYDAEDTYMSELNEDSTQITNHYCWSGNKIPVQGSEVLNTMPEGMAESWAASYKVHGGIYVADTSAVKDAPEFAKLAETLDIRNCISVPVISDGKVKGTITVYNFNKFKNDFTIAKTVSFFIFTEILKRKTLESAALERTRVISALAEGYDCIYYINLDEDKITLYRHDEKVNRLNGIKDNETVPFTSSYIAYVDSVVVQEDKEELYEFGSVAVLKSVLRDRKSVTKKFKSEISGKPEFYEAKWVKVEDADAEAKYVVLGYTNIEAKIQQRLKEERERELVQHKLDTVIEEAEEIVRESQFDHLTGIYNKISGLDIMKKFLSAKAEDEQYVLLFIDLDKFKEINDTYGHLEGDEILRGVGKAIKDNCSIGDIAVRFGGDEFIVLCKNFTKIDQAEEKARAISERINKLASGKFYYTNCSIGGFITDSRDLQQVMENADRALYQVKNNGRDGFKIVLDNK